MTASTGRTSTRTRVGAHRQRQRQAGLRPVQVWVADTRSAGFAAEAHRQSAAVALSVLESDDQAFIDAISDRADP